MGAGVIGSPRSDNASPDEMPCADCGHNHSSHGYGRCNAGAAMYECSCDGFKPRSSEAKRACGCAWEGPPCDHEMQHKQGHLIAAHPLRGLRPNEASFSSRLHRFERAKRAWKEITGEDISHLVSPPEWPPMPAWADDGIDDKPLPEDKQIDAVHPATCDDPRHDLYAEAMRLVGARRSKGGLVMLVHWLLLRAELAGKVASVRGPCPQEASSNCAREVCHWCHAKPLAWVKRHASGTWEGWCSECHGKANVPEAFGAEPFIGQSWATECNATITLGAPNRCSRGTWWCQVHHEQRSNNPLPPKHAGASAPSSLKDEGEK